MERNKKGQFIKMMSTMEKVKCLICGKTFTSYKKTKRKYCSWKCCFKKPASWKGKHLPLEMRRKLSESHKGYVMPEEQKIKISKNNVKYWLGKKRPEFSGSNHPNWNNGSSSEAYGLEFNKQLKEKIKQRDNYRCRECFRHEDELYCKDGKKYKLNIHHIDYNKRNNDPKNLISLCLSCHTQTNYKREDWTKYFSTQI